MNYKCLKTRVFSSGVYTLVPIRHQDRYDIMQWHKAQIYHLRQNRPLTPEDQEAYFEDFDDKLFNEAQPSQILFSFLEDDVCIGYGGLVHIHWINKNAELSFIMNPKLEKDNFQKHWSSFLKLIEQVAFEDMKFHKIFSYAFDLRPKLYSALELAGYTEEARLKEQCLFENKFLDVVIHSKVK